MDWMDGGALANSRELLASGESLIDLYADLGELSSGGDVEGGGEIARDERGRERHELVGRRQLLLPPGEPARLLLFPHPLTPEQSPGILSRGRL